MKPRQLGSRSQLDSISLAACFGLPTTEAVPIPAVWGFWLFILALEDEEETPVLT
jgi:hypothetical protein